MKIWTDFGLRSLSFHDTMYMKNNHYWTGPIWININYLILRGLKLHYNEHELARNTYDSLRKNVINGVCGNWEKDRYFYENYNNAGKGSSAHPFTGWTTIIALIISEKY